MAVWLWMPFSNTPRRRFFCDDCVPRTCRYCIDNTVRDDGAPQQDHRVKWRGSDGELHDERQEGLDTYCYVDEKGRPDPCCEYMYDKHGFEHEPPRYNIEYKDVQAFFVEAMRKKKYQDILGIIKEILWKFEESILNTGVTGDNYRTVIQWFRKECDYSIRQHRRDYDRYLIDSFFAYMKQTLYGLKKRVYPDFEDDNDTEI